MVRVPGLDALYNFYSFQVIPPLGHVIAGDWDSYQYLVESIRQVIFASDWLINTYAVF